MRRLLSLTAALTVPLLFSLQPAPAMAQAARGAASSDADLAEINRYRLTEDKLNKFVQATRNMAQVAKDNPNLLRNEEGRSMNNASLAQMAAIYDKHPPIKRAITSAGMTSREYVVFTFAMFQAGMASWAAKQPGAKLPPGVSRENIAFIDSHKEQLDRITKEFQSLERNSRSSDDAADDEDGDDEEEDEEEDEDEDPPVR